MIGKTVGPYQVTAKLGEGGMGEVYRARDAKLNREVALKVLLPAVANDPDRLARFSREAQVLASLNHPNIAHIHGIEESDDVTALVMELVDGEDLAQRIARGALAIDDAPSIAKQIADALEAAHEQGIIHRDLKPANIKVRDDGTVKVLDFGLAKLGATGATGATRATGAAGAALTSPAMTQAGIILGTGSYMSPEQARGKLVDRRADIWAFGCVLYEMITGTRAFDGDTLTDVLGAIVHKEPDWTRLPADTPAPVKRVLRKCLEKDPRRRLRDIGDARLDLEEPVTSEVDAGVAVASTAIGRKTFVPWLLCAILAIALAASWLLRPADPVPVSSRYPIGLSDGQRIGPTTWAPMAVSPDGSRLVYVGESGRLMVRSRDQLNSIELAGTDGAFNPFFSPDGSRVGFMVPPAGNAQLRVIPVQGGPTTLITTASVGGPGAAWGSDGFIYYDSSGVGPLRRVRETGGESEVVSTLDEQGKELQHNWPDALPGGRGVLITINRGGPGVNISQSDDVGVIDLATRRHRILAHGVLARYAASGHLVYVTAEGVLMAAPFDEQRLEVTGASVPLIEGFNIRAESGGIDLAISRSGTLWYATGTRRGRQEVLWATPSGVFTPVDPGWIGAFESLALSPDGSKLALTITDDVGQQIWVKDLTRPQGALTKVTHQRANKLPRWHPDGTRVAFVSSVTESDLRSARVDGITEPSVIASDLIIVDGGWTPDGQWLVYSGQTYNSRVFREDVHAVRPGVEAKPVPLVATPTFNERRASVSADGRWLVFESNATDRYEVYVRPFPETSSAQWPVSTGGGVRPKWSRDGRHIYYQNGTNQLTRVAVGPGAPLSLAQPTTLFSLSGVQDWDVAADGRIIVIRAAESDRGGQLIVVEDFFQELRQKAPK